MHRKLFRQSLITFLALFMVSCGNDNPTSPSGDDTSSISGIAENISITVTYEDEIPSAYINSLAKIDSDLGLVEVHLKNSNSSSVQLITESEIENYSNSASKTITLGADSEETINLIPLISDTRLQTLTENKAVNYRTSVTLIKSSTENEIFAETHSAQLFAKDVAVLQTDLLPLIALWVTPHTTKIDELISNAKNRHPDNQFVGYQHSPAGDGYNYGVTIPCSGTITIPAGESRIIGPINIHEYYIGPSIEGSFSVTSGNDIKVTIEDSNSYLYQSGQVSSGTISELLPIGTCYLRFDNTFSWITSKTVSYSFTINYDEDIIYPQVKAIYDALKNDYNISYVNSVISYPDGTQRVRLPNDALTYGSANCIDGAVLFASALENISLDPIICFVPGHAFVGWRRWEDSNVCEFLETTMVGNYSYDDAYSAGVNKFEEYQNSEELIIIDIEHYRSLGLTPMMKIASQ